MPSESPRSGGCRDKYGIPGIADIIDQFPPYHCASVRRIAVFAEQSPRLADLARTHPILFVALATGYGDPLRRAAAIDAALSGVRLRKVCELVGIPFCLRGVPRGLCPLPLPHADWTPDASAVLAQFIPDDWLTLCNWVHAVFFANGAAGEGFALWLALRHELFKGQHFSSNHLLPVALYAWFAQHPEHELHALLPARWQARNGSKRVLCATRAWLYRICCRIYLPCADDGHDEAVRHNMGPFHAIALTDYRTLLAEQKVMDNCLDRYGRRIALGTHAIFSLRTHSGVRIANFEVGLHAPDGPLVTEIKGRSNAPVPAEIYDPVLRWVAAASPTLRRSGIERNERENLAEDNFARLIAPYIQDHQHVATRYGPITLDSLERDMDALARQLHINNWPVRFE
jgi:hypothetical protein